jgi:pterin-4a-carbinolamine dehydratase
MAHTAELCSDDQIARQLGTLREWQRAGSAIQRTYETTGWPATLMLVNAIAHIAEAADHHPDLAVGYARVTVTLSTHSAGGLTIKDFVVARRIEETAGWQPDFHEP